MARSDLLTCAQEEGYPPPAEMPIKKLEFTPFKPPPAAKVSNASSKDSLEDAEAGNAENSNPNAEVGAITLLAITEPCTASLCEILLT